MGTYKQIFQNYFFGVLGKKLLVFNHGREIYVDLHLIKEVKLSKTRNLTTNVFISFIIIGVYYYSFLYFRFNLTSQIVVDLAAACVLSVIFAQKFYTNTLFIITKGDGLQKINIPESKLTSVIDFRDNFFNKTIVINNLEF